MVCRAAIVAASGLELILETMTKPWSWMVGVVLVIGCGSEPQSSRSTEEPEAPEPTTAMALEDDVVTAQMPTAAEVAAMIARSYPEPKLLVVNGKRSRDTMVSWQRSYDGIPVMADAKTVNDGNVFRTRFYRELAAPERVRRNALISKADAIAKSGLAAETAELLYYPKYGQLQKPNTAGTNAMDWDQVIERSDLVYVVDRLYEQVFVDAYSGEIRGRVSAWRH
jgi:hypothetical protein